MKNLLASLELACLVAMEVWTNINLLMVKTHLSLRLFQPFQLTANSLKMLPQPLTFAVVGCHLMDACLDFQTFHVFVTERKHRRHGSEALMAQRLVEIKLKLQKDSPDWRENLHLNLEKLVGCDCISEG